MQARYIMNPVATAERWDGEDQAAALLGFIDELAKGAGEVGTRLRAYLESRAARQAVESARPFGHAGSWID
jgi:hypothetical protein